MISRPTPSWILLSRIIPVLLLCRGVTSISLSQFQQIQGFSVACEDVWQQQIPGCTVHDFESANQCSRSCLAGVEIINAEVLVACADAKVSENTLLGEFLLGDGVSAVCRQTTATAKATTMTPTTTTEGETTTAMNTGQPQPQQQSQTTTTVPSATDTATDTATLPSLVSNPTYTTTTTALVDPNLTLSFTTGNPTTSMAKTSLTSTESAKTPAASATSNPEAKGFGGVGDAFNILGGDGARLAGRSGAVMTVVTGVIILAVNRGW